MPEKIFLCVGLAGFGGSIILLGIALFISYIKMELMLHHLSGCRGIAERSFLLNVGPWGRLQLLGAITGLMIRPQTHLRDGNACVEDLESFPEDIKRKLIILCWSSLPILALLFSLYLLVEFGFF